MSYEDRSNKKSSRFSSLFRDVKPSDCGNGRSYGDEQEYVGESSHLSRKRDYEADGNSNHSSDSQERRRKRRSRWANNDTDNKVVIPGIPTIMPSNLTPEQEKIYILQLQIEEITRKLRSGDLGIPENVEERSPSPEPVYNSEGKRLNTREYRVRKQLEEDRHQLIQKMLGLNPSYKTPFDYKPPQTKLCDKVLIPQEEYPDINFVGLLIGPRGNTLKGMERDTGAKIIIRGKGSIKEGKIGRKDGQPLPGEDEPLHAFLTAPTEGSIQAATREINKIIRQAIELPENQNNLRRSQLRELALLNGTLRENDMLSNKICSNCGSHEHRNWQCPEKTNLVNTIICSKCEGRGHLEKDCRFDPNTHDGEEMSEESKNKIDEEYLSLMAELGEAPPTASSKKDYSNLPPPSLESNGASSSSHQSANGSGSWKQPSDQASNGSQGGLESNSTETSTAEISQNSAASMDPATYYATYGKQLAAYGYAAYGYNTPNSTSAGYSADSAQAYANYAYSMNPAAGYNYAAYYAMNQSGATGTQSTTTGAPPPPPSSGESNQLPPPPPSH